MSDLPEDIPPKPAKKRRRTKQTVGLEKRLGLRARDDRERARWLRPSKEREDLLRRARWTEEAARMMEWLTTPSSRHRT